MRKIFWIVASLFLVSQSLADERFLDTLTPSELSKLPFDPLSSTTNKYVLGFDLGMPNRMIQVPAAPLFNTVAVSLAPQVLSPAQQTQARSNIAMFSDLSDRAPGINDNSSVGMSATSLWQSSKVMYAPVAAPTATTAAWDRKLDQSALPVDISASTIFAGGLRAVKAGYTGNAIDISVTIATTPTTFTIGILADGKLDENLLRAKMALADSGTSVTVIKWYDQNGTNHAVKDTGNSGLLIEYDPVLKSFVVFGDFLGNQRTLKWGTSFALNNNSYTVFAAGRGQTSATNGYGYIVSLGDKSLAGPFNIWTGLQTFGDGNIEAFVSGTSNRFPIVGGTAYLSIACAPVVFMASGDASDSYISINETEGIASGGQVSKSYQGGWIFSDGSSNRTSMMRLTELVIWNTPLTSAQRTAVRRGGYYRNDVRPQVLDTIMCIGDSRMTGYNSTRGSSIADFIARKTNQNWKVFNMGSIGYTAQQYLTSQIATITSRGVVSGPKYVAVLLGGVNDVITNNATVAQAVGYLQADCAALKALGYYVILIPELATATTTNGANTKVPQIISSINSLGTSGMGCDVIVDVSTYSEVQGTSNGVYYSDGLHPTAAVLSMISDAVIAKLPTNTLSSR